MFYCREKELSKMNRRFTGGEFECIVIYGRLRVGKTALINEFCRDKPTIFFSALDAPGYLNLSMLSKAIRYYQAPEAATYPEYRTFADALADIGKLAEEHRLVFVIDEYPYLSKAEPSLSSQIQHAIDHVWSRGKMFLILCGSSLSFMERQVLGHASPLYGRRTAQFKIEPLTYKETALFNHKLAPEQNALIYGITGGIPHYINKLKVRENVDEALLDNFFDPSSYLFEEPANLLKQELREPAVYSAILAAIAGGASKLSEIASQCHLESGYCARYIGTLTELGIIQKEIPLSTNNPKKGIYYISDSFFRFWYKFVPGNIDLITSERLEKSYPKLIKAHLPEFMGQVFEKMCRDYLLHYAEDLPCDIGAIGRWWGNDPQKRQEIEIDIVTAKLESECIVGSCKYRNYEVGMDEFSKLKDYAYVYAKGGICHYYLFAKEGFSAGLQDAATRGEVRLISLRDMY